MLYSSKSTLEDRVVELLIDDRLTIKSLYAKLNKEKKLSLRAIYAAVNKLIATGVLLKIGKRIVVDREWTKHVEEKLSSAPALLLAPGERVAYTFVSMERLDAFWKTTVLPLEQLFTTQEIFFYNPHDFWAYMPERKQSEDAYYEHFADSGQYGFFTIGGDSQADIEFKRKYQNEHLQIDMRDMRIFKRTDHITALNSFIITVRIAKGVANSIDKLYASGARMEDILPEIIRICEKPGKIRFLMENNALKANKLKKMLARNFYFNRAVIEESRGV